jgi:DUF4097 and DUF4098 domain-containing protein YvlB
MQGTGCAAITAVLILALAVAVPGCVGVPGAEETEQFNRTVAVEPGSDVTVVNRNGGVNVSAWEEDYVSIDAVIRSVWGRGELDRVRIEVKTDDGLRIETVHTGINVRASVDYSIRVPQDVALRRVESSNGHIVLAGTRGTEAITSNGNIIGRDARIVAARTSNGNVLVDGAPGGDLTAHSSNGRIEIRGAEGYVTATTSNARITVEESEGIGELRTSNGPITAEVPAVRGDVTVTSSNGRITLRLAEGLNARVVATTSNGRVSVEDLPLVLEESTATSLSGTIGDGGPTITVRTSNGDIELYRL